jgi:hypothetical protein
VIHSLCLYSVVAKRVEMVQLHTEGSSYFQVADTLDLWAEGAKKTHIRTSAATPNTISNMRARTATEEFSTDSFENM